ncbi:MAG: tetratricopeptide repeat protein [Cyanobacteria bacterium P01_A01_bin.105]
MQPPDNLEADGPQPYSAAAQGTVATATMLTPAQTQWLQQQVCQVVINKNYSQAIRLLDQLIESYPCHAEYYSNRGLMYYRSQRWGHALLDYNRALRLNGQCDRTYNHRANCYAAQQSWYAAISDYDRAIDINPFNTQARLNQGVTLRSIGQYQPALSCFDIALFFGALMPAIYAERGRTYHLMGHWNCAMGDYQRALSSIYSADMPENQVEKLRTRIHHWQIQLLSIED